MGLCIECGRCSRLMVSALDSRASSLGPILGQGYHVVFLGKTLYCLGASLHPGVQMGVGKFNAGVTPQWTNIPFRRE